MDSKQRHHFILNHLFLRKGIPRLSVRHAAHRSGAPLAKIFDVPQHGILRGHGAPSARRKAMRIQQRYHSRPHTLMTSRKQTIGRTLSNRKEKAAVRVTRKPNGLSDVKSISFRKTRTVKAPEISQNGLSYDFVGVLLESWIQALFVISFF